MTEPALRQLKSTFIELVSRYSNKEALAAQLWKELEDAHTHKKRHYHTLDHLANLYAELLPMRSKINNWEVVLFSLFYHDSVYNVLKQNNEEKSALLAQKRLQQLSLPTEFIATCIAQIEATKSHAMSDNTDTNIFTDADLSILGKSAETYDSYSQQVRQEYAIYPDLVYFPGRKKVLRHLLEMDRLYKTKWFYDRYESTARLNLQRELENS